MELYFGKSSSTVQGVTDCYKAADTALQMVDKYYVDVVRAFRTIKRSSLVIELFVRSECSLCGCGRIHVINAASTASEWPICAVIFCIQDQAQPL